MKKLISLVLSIVILCCVGLSLGEAAPEDVSVEAIQEKGTLVLGLDDSFPPMGYRNEAGEIVGFDIDVAEEVARRLGVTLEKQPIDWSAKELELASGNIDCIWNGMSITPARQESMSMTFSYLNNQIIFYALKDAGLGSLEDLAGKKVAVQGGSSAETLLQEDSFQELAESFAEVLAFDDYLTALMDLEQGGVDAVLIDKVVAEYKIEGMGVDDITPVVSLEDDNYGIGFRKEDVSLRDRVQEILIEMKQDGSLGEIATQWFGADITSVPAE